MYKTIWLSNGKLQFLDMYALEIYLVVVIMLLVAAVISDVREHRIPNWIVATGALIAVAIHTLTPFGQGLGFSISGLAVGIAGLLPLYIMGTMGAGDVKLMGMVGSYLGAPATLSALLATMVAGGVLALLATVYKRALPQLVENLRTMLIQRDIRRMGGTGAEVIHAQPSVGKLPYAVAIATGTAVQIFMLRP